MPPADPAPPPAPSRPPPGVWWQSRRTRLWLGGTLLAAGFIAAFDPTWFRPLIQFYIHERSGRRIDFDELHLGLNRELQPTVRLRNLVVQNAPWASPGPLVRAASFGFTLSWESLRGDRTIVTRLDMVDAELDLERQADGLRNWRLTRPEDRGPGRIRVLAIDASNTRARYVDRGLSLQLDLQATPLEAPVVLAANADLPLTKQLVLHGTREGKVFDAQFAVSDRLTLFDTARPFAVRGELRVGSSHAAVEGRIADLFQLARLDLDLRLASPSAADLGLAVGLHARLPPLATEARAHVMKAGAQWQVSALKAQVGRSELAGELQFDRKSAGEGRSLLRATLTSQRISMADFRSHSPAVSAGKPTETIAPGEIDADLDLAVGQVDGLPVGPVTDVKAHAALREGRWAVDPAAFAVAGGHATGTLAVDTVAAPAAYVLDLRLQRVQIAQLARATARRPSIAGALDLHLAMRSRGESIAALAGAAAGTLQAKLTHATIPDVLDAKLALDGGRLLRSWFGSNGRTAVTCSALDLRFEAGRGTARRLALETPHVALTGTGWIDLGRASVEVVLTPHRKQSALLALDRSVQVSGPLAAPKVALVEIAGAEAGEACLPGSAP